MMRAIARTIVFAAISLAALVAVPAFAQEAPDAMVKRVSQDTLATIRSDPLVQSGDQAHIRDLIEVKLVPHFDFMRMTALAMGRNWRNATPEQQKQLADQFRALLVRTYAGALNQYRSETIDYKPFKMNPDDTEVTVRTQVTKTSGQPVSDRLLAGKDARGLEGVRRHRRRREPRHQLPRRVQRADQERRHRRPHQDARRPQQGSSREMTLDVRAGRGRNGPLRRRRRRPALDVFRRPHVADAGPALEAARELPLPADGVVDCAGIEAVDSTAVAVLLALKRRAAQERKPLRYTNVPDGAARPGRALRRRGDARRLVDPTGAPPQARRRTARCPTRALPWPPPSKSSTSCAASAACRRSPA